MKIYPFPLAKVSAAVPGVPKMYCTWLPAKGLPSMAVTEAGIWTASAAMPWKASASMVVRAASKKGDAGHSTSNFMPLLLA